MRYSPRSLPLLILGNRPHGCIFSISSSAVFYGSCPPWASSGGWYSRPAKGKAEKEASVKGLGGQYGEQQVTGTERSTLAVCIIRDFELIKHLWMSDDAVHGARQSFN